MGDQEYRRSQRPDLVKAQEEYLSRCSVKATNGFISGTVLGATMSGLTGMARATQMQIRFPAAVRAVIGATVAGGLAFGVALGTYQGTVCAIRKIRGVDDIKNPVLAGALVGAMSEIPVFIRSKIVTKADMLLAEQGMHVVRPRPRFLMNAAGGAVVCGLFYMLGDAMRPEPLPKPQGSPSQPPPPAPSSSPSLNEVESLNTLEDQDTGEWVFSEPPPSEELLETENLTWDSK